MPRGTEVGLGDIVLDMDPTPPHRKGHSSLTFRPCPLWSNSRPSQQQLSSCWVSVTITIYLLANAKVSTEGGDIISVINNNSIYANESQLINSIYANESQLINSIYANESQLINSIYANESQLINSIYATESKLINSIYATESQLINSIYANESQLINSIYANESQLINSIYATESQLINSIYANEWQLINSIYANESQLINSIYATEWQLINSIYANESQLINSIYATESQLINSIYATEWQPTHCSMLLTVHGTADCYDPACTPQPSSSWLCQTSARPPPVAMSTIMTHHTFHTIKKVKVKASHTRYRALGPELIPVYRQSARRWP